MKITTLLTKLPRNIACIALAICVPSCGAFATTTTTTFGVSLTLNADCVINSASDLNFGSSGVLSAEVDQTSTIAVQCTDTTPYDIGLDAGLAAGATVTTRQMTGATYTALVNYALYSNVGMTTNWGNTVAVDTVSATGNGASQSYTVYGKVPAQTTPAPDSYADTITVTVTY